MLLIEKSSNRIVRQNTDEIKNSISLHLSILQHYPITMQIFVGTVFQLLMCKLSINTQIFAELLRESLRLIVRLHNPADVQPTFLDVSL